MDGREHRRAQEERTNVASEGTTCANFSASRTLAKTGTAQVQAGMEAWWGTDIGAFRCEDAA